MQCTHLLDIKSFQYTPIRKPGQTDGRCDFNMPPEVPSYFEENRMNDHIMLLDLAL